MDWTPDEIESRPRLLASADDFERARGLVGDDERATAWFDEIERRGESLLGEPPSEYAIPDGKRLLAVSRQVLQRTVDLATLYRVTGEDRYAERLWRELDAVAGFPDWNPSHFLDVGEMTAAMAVGYDWAHEYWSETQLDRIAQGILELGLEAARPAYESLDQPSDPPEHCWWVEGTNNWNTVCNGGLSMGAFALLGDERGSTTGARPGELHRTVIEGARASIERAIGEIGPGGGWNEGLVYWGYNARYLTYYLSSLLGTFGTADGLLERPGISTLGDFPLYLTGPTDCVFSFGDSSEDRVCAPTLQWLARQFDQPALARYQWRSLDLGVGGRHDGTPEATDLLWYEPSVDTEATAGREFDRHFPGGDHAVTFRSGWADPEATFLGFKAGHNQTSHGDLDVGTFVFDDRGVRWAKDLGAYDYREVEPEFWDRGADGDRWNFYRKRAEGHNTLVVDPGESPDQDPLAECEIETVQSTGDAGVAIADTSAAYPSANSVRRGVRLHDGRSTLTVQDEIVADGVEVWWFMHTRAGVSVDGRTATLERGGESLDAAVLSPSDASFRVREASPLPSSPTPLVNGKPKPEVDEPIEGVRKLAIGLTDVSETTLTVRLGPEVNTGSAPGALASWIGE
jgi:hypothetical protein